MAKSSKKKTTKKVVKKITKPRKKPVRQTGKPDKYAYDIEDKYFEKLQVLNTANAWWLDRTKVGDIISAFKIDCNQQEACTYAGITIAQFKYFKTLHPDFSTIIEACRSIPTIKARKAAVDKLDDSYSNAMDYLERKHKDEFSKKKLLGAEIVTTEMDDKHKARVVEILKENGDME